jgi:hypothetical protein
MATNNSADDVMRADSHSYGKVLLWVCGSSAAVFVCDQAIRWGLETLRTQFLATLSAALLSAMPVLLTAPAGTVAANLNSGSCVAQTVRNLPNK